MATCLPEARRATRDQLNVMFQPGSPEIPWRDGYFTRVIDLDCNWAYPDKTAGEITRVLASGGSAYLATTEPQHLLNAGLRPVATERGIEIFQALA